MWNSLSNFRIRQAAVIALVGWYLMQPLIRNGKAVDLTISQWAHVDSFDTASECRDGAYQAAQSAEMRQRKQSNEYLSALSFECIASDDPRLKGN
jgi:hypothetical protein